MCLKDVIEEVGSKLSRERKKKGWRQSELSEISGVAEKTIGQLENFKGNPTLKTIDKIAHAFDLELEDFLNQKK